MTIVNSEENWLSCFARLFTHLCIMLAYCTEDLHHLFACFIHLVHFTVVCILPFVIVSEGCREHVVMSYCHVL